MSFLKLILIIAIALTAKNAIALDLIQGDKLNKEVEPGYPIKATDTFAGYAMYSNDGDWSFSGSTMGSTTGGLESLKQPFIFMQRYEYGKWAIGQTITVTISGDGGRGGWMGDPCGGERILKINVVRGRLDRCSSTQIKSLKIGGVQTDTLEINFIETNFGGRLYNSVFNLNLDVFGLNYRTVNDKSSEFNTRLKDWMSKMLDATVKAADYSKPSDAFKDIPPLTEVIKGIKNSPLSNSENINSSAGQPKNIETRLQTLKDLLDKRLITKEDYDKKRTDILNSL